MFQFFAMTQTSIVKSYTVIHIWTLIKFCYN